MLRSKGLYLRQHGRDSTEAFARAAECFERAAADPTYLFAQVNQVDLYTDLAESDFQRGVDPEPHVRKALRAADRALGIDPGFYSALNAAADAALLQTEYLLRRGGDPRPLLERALEYLERSRRANPDYGRTWFRFARVRHLSALLALREGGDAGARLDEGRLALEQALRLDARCVECHVVGAQLEEVAAAWAARRGLPGLPHLQRALAEARRAVALFSYGEAHQELARVYWLLARAQPPARAGSFVKEGG
ncbi:serine/threonine kinase family protein [Cystobacter fuscus DSM 2262]|uniref:Serine/threonine kinase family protein n=1 Tax=Cystobacter fuscus (strain ATCC 25194 / DSM 2262 / NBRC 100088 / M29) TaxID=1242864 RepID=S9NS72_CYSF2|nr:hypothetical protein [Cystobacter fuscus]EPX54970.1 serine/threonine kinase family protein [Cystobacter fuscus DSM 2262]